MTRGHLALCLYWGEWYLRAHHLSKSSMKRWTCTPSLELPIFHENPSSLEHPKNVVHNDSSNLECTLVFRDHKRKQFLHSISKHFREQFVNNVTKANRPKF